MVTVQNEFLTVQIDKMGAELRSIKTADGTEYLWQGDAAIWEDQAPNLFPYIARLTQKQYTYGGNTYHMGSHGFAKNTLFTLEQQREGYARFCITDTAETRAQYPFHFYFAIEYILDENKLSVNYIVKNTDEKTLYFGVGGHPGFRVPLEEGLNFNDYYLEFDTVTDVLQVGMSPDCYVTEQDVPFVMADGKTLPLHHDMFDNDAIILTQMSKGVTLKSAKGTRGLRVAYPKLDYLGIWHRPFTEAPYVCIEPWSSLPSRKDVIEDLTTQPSLRSLEPNALYEATITYEVLQ